MPIKKIVTTFTDQQLNWLKRQIQETGLPRSEILRRALDNYREAIDKKRESTLFTAEQVRDIQKIAKRERKSEREVTRDAIQIGLQVNKNR